MTTTCPYIYLTTTSFSMVVWSIHFEQSCRFVSGVIIAMHHLLNECGYMLQKTSLQIFCALHNVLRVRLADICVSVDITSVYIEDIDLTARHYNYILLKLARIMLRLQPLTGAEVTREFRTALARLMSLILCYDHKVEDVDRQRSRIVADVTGM